MLYISKTLKSAIERLRLLPDLREGEELFQAAVFLKPTRHAPDTITYEVYVLTSQRLCINATGREKFEVASDRSLHLQIDKEKHVFTYNDHVISNNMSVIIKDESNNEWRKVFSVKEYENEKDFHNNITREEFFDMVRHYWKTEINNQVTASCPVCDRRKCRKKGAVASFGYKEWICGY